MSARYYEYQQWLYDNYTSRGVVTNITFEKWKEMQSKKENKNKKIKIRKDMKIPFDIKFRPQIESGEYRVETQAGCPVRIVCWDMACELPILGLVLLNDEKAEEMAVGFTNEGTNLLGEPLYDKLFIVTPEEKLSEFEKACMKLYNEGRDDGLSGDKLSNESVKESAAELLALAIDARANELSECLQQSKLDIDSIPYHLIEFMCNLYTCQNWKEIKEIAEAYTTRVKAAALKDLPRWRKWKNGACGNGRGIPLAIVKRGLDGYELVDALGIQGEQYIMLSDFEKLPGFNE